MREPVKSMCIRHTWVRYKREAASIMFCEIVHFYEYEKACVSDCVKQDECGAIGLIEQTACAIALLNVFNNLGPYLIYPLPIIADGNPFPIIYARTVLAHRDSTHRDPNKGLRLIVYAIKPDQHVLVQRCKAVVKCLRHMLAQRLKVGVPWLVQQLNGQILLRVVEIPLKVFKEVHGRPSGVKGELVKS
jgi:hypothetical protein